MAYLIAIIEHNDFHNISIYHESLNIYNQQYAYFSTQFTLNRWLIWN